MKLTERQIEGWLPSFEGLVFTTSQQLVAQGVEQDHEDIAQQLRVKIWKALRSYDTDRVKRRAGESLEDSVRRYAFMCCFDQKRDLAKRKRRGDLYIEDVAPAEASRIPTGQSPRDKFDQRYLSTDHEQVYGGVEDEELLLPNTLTEREREVVEMMMCHYRQTEIADLLDVSKREVEKAVRSIRIKLADWRPEGASAGVEIALSVLA